MTPDELRDYAEAVAVTVAMWRGSSALSRSEGEAVLIHQGLSPRDAKAVIEYGITQGWLVEGRVDGTTVLHSGRSAVS